MSSVHGFGKAWGQMCTRSLVAVDLAPNPTPHVHDRGRAEGAVILITKKAGIIKVEARMAGSSRTVPLPREKGGSGGDKRLKQLRGAGGPRSRKEAYGDA